MTTRPSAEVGLGLDSDEPPAPDERSSRIVSPDDADDPARAPETLGIDNTDTALGAEDDSTPAE